MLTLNQFVAATYGDNFNAFSLPAQARILPGFVKGSNLPSLYNSCFQIAACIKSLFQVLLDLILCIVLCKRYKIPNL